MKASELIKELQGRINKNGDCEVCYYIDNEGDGLRLEPIVSVWGIFKDDTKDVERLIVCDQEQHDFQVENQDITMTGDEIEEATS